MNKINDASDDELDELSKDSELQNVLKLRTPTPTKASPELEQRLRESFKQNLAKKKRGVYGYK